MIKEWKIKPPVKAAEQLARALRLSPLVAQMLARRGITTAEAAEAFLHPEAQPFHDPMALQDMAQAVARIGQAIEAGERIVIYGDYDVDGITSTTLMLRNLRALGAQVDYYIPDRSEGYGFNEAALQQLAAQYDLLVSVDCGIGSTALVAELAGQLDFVITDHHLPGATLPPAVAVVNPHRAGERYPFQELCGCGVAFKLCQALWRKLKGVDYQGDLELVALGTVADVVPLLDENRKIVKMGLAQMHDTSIAGLQALLQVTKLDDKSKELNSGHIGFVLGPRLNSAGRMASARLGVELLMSKTLEAALPLAQQLNELNTQRQTMEQDILVKAEAQLAAQDTLALPAVIVAGEGWHQGVIGIVGSRLVEEYYRPTIVCTIQPDGTCKGSCRSIPGLNMYEALQACQDDLIQFGGHAQAAGLSLRAENLAQFRTDFAAYVQAHVTQADFVPQVDIEAELAPEEVTEDLVTSLAELAPFGEGNPEPAFGMRSVRGWGARAIGKQGEHLLFNVGSQEQRLAVLYWRHGELVNAANNELLDIVYEPAINEYMGRRSVQLMASAVEPAQSERVAPTRDILVQIYRLLVQLQRQEGGIQHSDDALAQLFSQCLGHISLYTMQLGLQIFTELGLLTGTGTTRQLPPATEHLDLAASPTYRHYCGA